MVNMLIRIAFHSNNYDIQFQMLNLANYNLDTHVTAAKIKSFKYIPYILYTLY